jgi:hypothetical protein
MLQLKIMPVFGLNCTDSIFTACYIKYQSCIHSWSFFYDLLCRNEHWFTYCNEAVVYTLMYKTVYLLDLCIYVVYTISILPLINLYSQFVQTVLCQMHGLHRIRWKLKSGWWIRNDKKVNFYLWVLHPVAHLFNWFFMMPSIATKFQYVNSLLFSFSLTTCFGPFRWDIQLDILMDYF